MKRYLTIIKSGVLLALMTAFAVSCAEEAPEPGRDIPGLGGYPSENTPLDQWLMENYAKPYNIEVVYRWNSNELSTTAQLVPMFEYLVQPTMDMIRQVWFAPYETLAGSSFIRQMAPKKIVLVGSPQYNTDGSKVLGQAEGARKITLFDGNNYQPTNAEWIREIMHTIEHEFAHILHQTRSYGASFRELSAGSYSPTGWQNYSETLALYNGFYSSYAMSAVDEDFVETISLLVVYGMDWRQERMDLLDYWATLPPEDDETPEDAAGRIAISAQAYASKQKLLAKEEIVSAYLQDKWGVRLFDSEAGGKGLITLVQEAIQKVIDDNTDIP